MLNISNNDEKYLASDKIVTKEFKLKDQDVLTSSNSLFIKNDNNVRFVDYANISSIELLVRRNLLVISIGIILVVASLCLQQLQPPSWAFKFPLGRLMWGFGDGGSAYIMIGMILMLIGFLWKTLSIKFKVASPNDEFVLSGKKNTINALARFVNEHRVQTHSNSG